jgi:hypothetical protein
MNIPAEYEDINSSFPSIEELKQELSNIDLQNRGIFFAAQYLLYRMILANGCDSSKKASFQEVEQRLRQLFPQQDCEWLPGYLQRQGNMFKVAFDWASNQAYEESKVGRVEAFPKNDIRVVDLETGNQASSGSADVYKEFRSALILATKDLIGLDE